MERHKEATGFIGAILAAVVAGLFTLAASPTIIINGSPTETPSVENPALVEARTATVTAEQSSDEIYYYPQNLDTASVPTYQGGYTDPLGDNEELTDFIYEHEGEIVHIDVIWSEELTESAYYEGYFNFNICRAEILAWSDGSEVTPDNCPGLRILLPVPKSDNDYLYYYDSNNVGYRIKGYFKINGIRHGRAPEVRAIGFSRFQIVPTYR
jgi:hypothetical protein